MLFFSWMNCTVQLSSREKSLASATRVTGAHGSDVNVKWLAKVLSAAAVVSAEESEGRARAIYAAFAGAQLMARSRSDISLYDALIESYRVAGLLPA